MSAPEREQVLLFPGQGSQHTRMAAGLYDHDPVFTEHVDRALALFDDPRLRDAWLSDTPRVALDHVTMAQPLLFSVGYALGAMVLSWGVRPAALLGHSVGELVAATLAGVFDVADSVALMRDRVDRLADTPRGGMLTVSATVDDVAPYLRRHPQVAVGAVNAPRQTVLAGFEGPLGAVAGDLRADGFTVLPVAALSAFHSPVLAPLFEDPGPLAGCVPQAPRIPLWSAFAVDRLDARTVTDRALWLTQPVAPVHFWSALDKLLAGGPYLLTDVGPSQGLAMIARRHAGVKRGGSAVAALLPARPGTAEADRDAVRRWRDRVREEGHRLRHDPDPVPLG
ncbi:acyltransferase domain-containing protein [Micromonospora sp. NPDC002296]|uniref:acyltransferase domain-containing protein n=1 Tax=Micromonospora sp. NPDC002296 TaxID=3154271 RepID=UPI0033320ED3